MEITIPSEKVDFYDIAIDDPEQAVKLIDPELEHIEQLKKEDNFIYLVNSGKTGGLAVLKVSGQPGGREYTKGVHTDEGHQILRKQYDRDGQRILKRLQGTDFVPELYQVYNSWPEFMHMHDPSKPTAMLIEYVKGKTLDSQVWDVDVYNKILSMIPQIDKRTRKDNRSGHGFLKDAKPDQFIVRDGQPILIDFEELYEDADYYRDFKSVESIRDLALRTYQSKNRPEGLGRLQNQLELRRERKFREQQPDLDTRILGGQFMQDILRHRYSLGEDSFLPEYDNNMIQYSHSFF